MKVAMNGVTSRVIDAVLPHGQQRLVEIARAALPADVNAPSGEAA